MREWSSTHPFFIQMLQLRNAAECIAFRCQVHDLENHHAVLYLEVCLAPPTVWSGAVYPPPRYLYYTPFFLRAFFEVVFLRSGVQALSVRAQVKKLGRIPFDKLACPVNCPPVVCGDRVTLTT